MNLEFKYQDSNQEVVDFLYRVGYPHIGWDVDLMQRMQMLDGTLVGFVWFSWVPDTYKVLEFHVAVDHQFHGRWANQTVSNQVCTIANFLDARLLMIFWRDAKPLLKMRRLGWEVKPPFAWTEVENHGISS